MAEDPLAEVIQKAYGDWYDLPDTAAPLPALTEFQAAAVRAHLTGCCTADCCTEREMAEAERVDLLAENERLRALVQALEEECAARQEDGERLAMALDRLIDEALNGVPACELILRNGERAEAAHDALTARYAHGGPDPLPDPVEGDTEALSGQNEAPDHVVDLMAALEESLAAAKQAQADRKAPPCVECGHPLDAPHECQNGGWL